MAIQEGDSEREKKRGNEKWGEEVKVVVVVSERMEEEGECRERKNSAINRFEFCNPRIARYVYGFMFLLMNVLAWIVRDYGHAFLDEFKRFEECEGGRYCLGTEGVLRVSLGGFIFFFVMFVSTVGTSKLSERRNTWHSGWWLVKTGAAFVLTPLPFLLPNVLIRAYGTVAHFGAGVFLLIQLISVISLFTWINDCCRSEKYVDKCRFQVVSISAAAYIFSMLGIVLMYVWYAPKLSCSLNIFFITGTLVLLHLMAWTSLHVTVNAGYLTPGLMGLYVVFLCWCAIRSEPPTESCNKKAEATTSADWLSIISFIMAVIAIVIATFSTGIDSKSFQFKKVKAKSEADVPYGYGFFHFVFATGAMYFCMLLIGWNVHHTMQKWTIDVGWTSTWVRILNEWLAACVYIWMLIAPLIWKNNQSSGTT
ncbi:probable serine incorporator [Amborella trichopoda]|uniref:Serine incorporator n=1 Tax=Amborella trichopoda TaxID=13333 RepID=W1P7L9_AMBTC|nr:probable serine incorporator [Amborella trichopoda]ERN03923.1 hypothetical protein AMTR_s00078p00195500 [Amborella trichopoda]|eukprot:XP_006842248.1 probable serine incorporator [Amborella trichopoda]